MAQGTKRLVNLHTACIYGSDKVRSGYEPKELVLRSFQRTGKNWLATRFWQLSPGVEQFNLLSPRNGDVRAYCEGPIQTLGYDFRARERSVSCRQLFSFGRMPLWRNKKRINGRQMFDRISIIRRKC